MASKLITNQDHSLSEVFNNILPAIKDLYFLVGYFYFSGFEKIYEKVGDKKIKILVGMDIEKTIHNKIKEFELIEKINLSRGKIKDNYFKSLIQLFNDTDFFDSEEKQKAFKIYLEKIKDGSLEIKKTAVPNHAKMYLFENKEDHSQNGEFPGTLITGSSNFSQSGLSDRLEINVILRDSNDYIEGKKIFDQLWSSAVEIANKNSFEEFFNNVVGKTWFEKLPSPFLLYVRVLDELFSFDKKSTFKFPAEISKQRYFDLKYQIDAIQFALDIIKRHGGVIISDVVGLGKSIVASAVAYNLGIKTIIITPPHLFSQWEDYRFEFDVNAKVFSNGKIEEALSYNDDGQEKLIIIDEAHKYRNEMTNTYSDLHKLCQGNKVMLLTATPFNNRPQDIFSMIKLFQIPGKSTIQTAENLFVRFKELIKEYKDIQQTQRDQKESPGTIKNKIRELANQIRSILLPVMIRRTRLDLIAIDDYREDLEAQGISFPEVKPPKLLTYELNNLAELYLTTLKTIAPEKEDDGFIGARYKPVFYLKDYEKYRKKISEEFTDENLFKQSQINIAKFMRRLLVARFESSLVAFKTSLNYMIQSSQHMLNWFDNAKLVPIFKKGYIPDFSEIEDELDGALNDELKEQIFEDNIQRLREKGFEFIPSNELKVEFRRLVERDIKLLSDLKIKWEPIGPKEDPKLKKITAILYEKLAKEPQRKLVLFSSYADTINYLYEQMKGKLRVFKYTGSDASRANRNTIKENFDAGLPEEKQKNDYDVLLATDAISEGFNLHRAGAVFNYDIPYNPTRVIQRVGRINRINKKVFDELHIYNFFPTDIGEDEIGIKRISTLKKAVIDALLGEDTKVLTSDEELESYFQNQFKKEYDEQDELSWDAPYRKLLGILIKQSPEIIQEARNVPKRTRICRSISKEVKGVLLFGKKGDDSIFKIGINTKDVITVPVNEALKYFEAEIGEKAKPTSNGFEIIYQNVKENLFIKKTLIPSDKGRMETINKVKFLLDKFPEYRDYLIDLLEVIEKLAALPEQYSKQIRAISVKNLEKSFSEFRKAVPHRYLIEIIEKAKRIEEGVEYLILAEELI